VQFHLGAPEESLWPSTGGVTTSVPEGEVIDGMAECGFSSQADFEQWLAGSGVLMDDEPNVFAGTYGYYSAPGGSHSSGWRADTYDSDVSFTVLCLVRAHDDISRTRFRSYLVNDVAAALATSPVVESHAVHLLEDYESSAELWEGAAVDHGLPQTGQIDAMLEVTVNDRRAWQALLEHGPANEALRTQGEFFSTVHAYPVRYSPVLVDSGRLTAAGEFGYSTAEVIRQVGATNFPRNR
jgi:hypothetical protein